MLISKCELFNKYGEAIKPCKLDYELFPDDNKHLLIAIEALEKQIPKKKTESKSLGVPYRCGNCNHGLQDLGVRNKYCPECGQKINWED